MKILLFAISIFVTTASFTPFTIYHSPFTVIRSLPAQFVYIDEDPKETFYHSKSDCKDIKKGHKVKQVTLDDAINKYHLKPCPDCVKPAKK
ncbi:MAG: hypothetical protein ACLQQ4_14315 [Bacteroidia bacterium]